MACLFSNLIEDVFQVVNNTFILDYKRQLRFQALLDDTEAATEEPVANTVLNLMKFLKVLPCTPVPFTLMPILNSFLTSYVCKRACHKLSVRPKGTTIRQVLTSTVFLNVHHLHSEFQRFILLCVQTVYKSKKEVQADVTFFLIVSVSDSLFYFPSFWL